MSQGEGLHFSGLLMRVERQLSRDLSRADGLEESLRICYEAACKVGDLDCGGVYLFDQDSGALDLVFHRNLSDEFVAATCHFGPDSPNARLVNAGTPVYMNHGDIIAMDDIRKREDLRFVAVVPIRARKQIVGCLNLASRKYESIPVAAQSALETLAGQIGQAVLREQTLQQLKEREENLDTFFDSVRDFLFVLDIKGNMLRVNSTVLDRLGYRGEELIGRSVLMVHPEPRRDEALEILGGMLAGTVDYCPVPLVCKDGSQIPVATRVSEGRWNGRPALFGVSRDVGDRIRAQRELEESEARYRSMFEDNKAIKLLVDPESGLVVEANSAAGEFYGRSREALTGTPVRDLLVGDDLAMPCSTEDARVVSQRHRIKDGSVREVELHCSTLFFGERRLVYAIVHDVTERKRAERERQSNMHFLERMMDTIPLPVFYKDTTGIYLGCNQAYADFLGKAKLEIIGNTMDVAGTGEVARLCQLKDEALLASPGFQVYEHYMYNGSGEKRNVLFYKASFNNVEGTLGGIIGAMVDVTDEVEARTEREGLIDKLTRALEDVKTLRGFLPICSSCKKIRDDSGYWQQIEAYISTHSNAEFSHSICPECYKDLYPDLAAEDDDA